MLYSFFDVFDRTCKYKQHELLFDPENPQLILGYNAPDDMMRMRVWFALSSNPQQDLINLGIPLAFDFINNRYRTNRKLSAILSRVQKAPDRIGWEAAKFVAAAQLYEKINLQFHEIWGTDVPPVRPLDPLSDVNAADEFDELSDRLTDIDDHEVTKSRRIAADALSQQFKEIQKIIEPCYPEE